MNTFVKVFAILIALAGLVGGGLYYYVFQAGDKTPLESIVPSEAIAYADIKETRKLALELSTSSYGRAFAEFGKLFAGLIAVAQSAPDSNADEDSFDFPAIDWRPLGQAALHFNRQVACFTLASEVEELPFQAFAVAHYQGDPDGFTDSVQEFLDKASVALDADKSGYPPIVVQTETIDGLSIRYLPLPSAEQGFAVAWDIRPCWITVDDRWYAGLNPQSLAQYIRSIDTLTPETNLQGNEDFALVRAYQAEFDSQAFLNLERLIDNGLDLANETFGAQASQVGISLDQAIEALGLQELESTFYAVDFASNEVRITNGVLYDEAKGILALYENDGALEVPQFVPSDVQTSASASLDLGEMVLAIKDMVLEAAPLVSLMYPSYKQIADQQLGQDAEVFLREAFRPEFHSFSHMSRDPATEATPIAISQSQTYAIGLEDPDSFQALIDRQLAPFRAANSLPLQEVRAGAYTLFVMNDPEAGPLAPAFGYAIADRKLFFSYGTGAAALDPLKAALAMIDSDEAGAFQAPEVSRMIDANDENAIAYTLIDLGLFSEVAAQMAGDFRKEAERSGDDALLQGLNQIDWSILEEINMKMVGVSRKEDGILLSVTRLIEE